MEQEEGKVRVMSRQERNDYDGVTIEEGSNSDDEQSKTDFGYRGVRIHTLNWQDLLSRRGNWWQRALMIAGVAAVLGFLFFVALPVILVLVGVGVAVWLVLHLFLGR